VLTAGRSCLPHARPYLRIGGREVVWISACGEEKRRVCALCVWGWRRAHE
jgi:hypothetical protein